MAMNFNRLNPRRQPITIRHNYIVLKDNDNIHGINLSKIIKSSIFIHNDAMVCS